MVNTLNYSLYFSILFKGCPECFPVRDQKLAGGRTAEQLYERTQQRLFELENLQGFRLHVFWGHQLKERLKRDGTFRRIWEAIDLPERPLDPRKDALRGGRTEPFKLQHICAEDEKIIYIDIVSFLLWIV